MLLAETFLAAFQVFLADIASHDPVITCSAIDASIRADPDAKEAASIAIGPVTDNVISVSITMANEVADVNALAQGLVATAIELFSVVHARSHADLEQILGRMMRAGLPTRSSRSVHTETRPISLARITTSDVLQQPDPHRPPRSSRCPTTTSPLPRRWEPDTTSMRRRKQSGSLTRRRKRGGTLSRFCCLARQCKPPLRTFERTDGGTGTSSAC